MLMDRRESFRFIGSAAVAAGIVGVSHEAIAAKAAATATSGPSARQDSHIHTSDGTNLFYKDWGDGKPVVFASAWCLNSNAWDYQTNFLTGQGVHCVAYDRRGHGRSSQPGGGYDFDTLADDLATVIEQLDLHDATLVGHSMGAGEVVAI
jgi:alpha-beta hydrolase superfamily lysophospholipase